MIKYLVLKPFKSKGKFFNIGSVFTDPNEVKRLKMKINEGKVVEVTKENLKQITERFKLKYRKDITNKFVDKPVVKPVDKPVDKPVAVAKVVIKK